MYGPLPRLVDWVHNSFALSPKGIDGGSISKPTLLITRRRSRIAFRPAPTGEHKQYECRDRSGMAIFSRYSRIVEADGSTMKVRDALTAINQALDVVLAEQEADFDKDTRWAVAWYTEFGFSKGSAGVAETLSKAKNTSIGGLVRVGVRPRVLPSSICSRADPVDPRCGGVGLGPRRKLAQAGRAPRPHQQPHKGRVAIDAQNPAAHRPERSRVYFLGLVPSAHRVCPNCHTNFNPPALLRSFSHLRTTQALEQSR